MVNDGCDEWQHFFYKQKHYKTVKFEEVFNESSQLIMISGLRGVGKTNFLKNCIYHWANGLHWKNLNFVFYFEFNKINKLQSVSNMKQLIKKYYKNILKGYEISSFNATMFIIDGFDEFAYFEELNDNKSSNNTPIITVLGDISSSEYCKCVLSGNIATLIRYWGTIKDYKDPKIIQMMGLNVAGAKSILEDFSLSETLRTDLENLLTFSRKGAALLSIPLYLNAACSTLLSLSVKSVKTMTELETLIFLLFLQQNCKSKEPLQRVIQTKQQHILKVCRVAFILLDRGKKNISQNELGSVLDEDGFEPLGFIKKSVLSQQYQFVHFFIMKFCASVHLLFNVNTHEIITNGRLRNYLPFISGFIHRTEESFLSLICQLQKPLHKQTSWLTDIYGKINH